MTTLKQLFNNLILNGGLTLTKQLVNGLDNVNNGFMVSKADTEISCKINFHSFKKALRKQLINLHNLQDSNNYYIGLWVYENKIYIDLSMLIENKQQALFIGMINKQIAIFDIKNQKSIYINK